MRKARPLFLCSASVVLLALILTGLPSVASAQAPPYRGEWGSLGSANGQFNNPQTAAIDAFGNVYVVDTYNHRVQLFTSTGGFVHKWGAFGGGNGFFKFPQGIALDASGNVYIADTQNHRIQRFNSAGIYLGKFGTLGAGNGQFNNPTGVTIDGNGDVYVMDSGNNRVQKFTSIGAFITKWGTPGPGDGSFVSAQGIAAGAGVIYVADTGNNRVQMFSPAGAFTGKWGTSGAGPGDFNDPMSVAVGPAGVYVADRDNQRVQWFTAGGTFVAEWGVTGTGPGEFAYPRGIGVSSTGKVYVVDSNNRRVQYFFNSAPSCDGAQALHELVWPPNHDLVPVSIVGLTDPDGDPLTVTATAIWMDEPLNSIGDGNTCPDAAIGDDGTPFIRMERSGTSLLPGNGRVYHILFTASDGFGGTCEGEVTACVPHDQDGTLCVDDGPTVDALGRCSNGTRKGDPEVVATGVADLAVRTIGRKAVLQYSLAQETDVNLSVFDIAGRRLATLENSRKAPGDYSVTWEADRAQGMYFYRLQAGDKVVSKTVLHVE